MSLSKKSKSNLQLKTKPMNNCTTYLKIAILWIMVAIYSIGHAQDHHTLPNRRRPGGTLETAGTSLTANEYVIQSGGSSIFGSGERILLKNGFKAKSGSNFHALIQPSGGGSGGDSGGAPPQPWNNHGCDPRQF